MCIRLHLQDSRSPKKSTLTQINSMSSDHSQHWLASCNCRYACFQRPGRGATWRLCLGTQQWSRLQRQRIQRRSTAFYPSWRCCSWSPTDWWPCWSLNKARWSNRRVILLKFLMVTAESSGAWRARLSATSRWLRNMVRIQSRRRRPRRKVRLGLRRLSFRQPRLLRPKPSQPRPRQPREYSNNSMRRAGQARLQNPERRPHRCRLRTW